MFAGRIGRDNESTVEVPIAWCMCGQRFVLLTGHCGLHASKAWISTNSGKMVSSSSVTSTMRRRIAFGSSGSILILKPFIFSSFVLAVLNMGIDRTGRLACACHKLLFVRGGSGTETVNERSSEHRHERRDRQSPMIVEGNRIKRR